MALRSIATTDTLETFRTTANSHISDVGDLASLGTTDKSSIVAALNEVNVGGGNWNISDSTSTIENIASGGTLNVIGSTGISATVSSDGSDALTIAVDTAVVATTTNSLTMTNKTLSSVIITDPAVSDGDYTGAQVHAAGSASAPTITKTGDVNTGMYWAAADQIDFALGGNQRYTFDDGALAVKNSGGNSSGIQLYCESSNAHYAEVRAPAHSTFGGNVVYTLPDASASDTLVSKTSTDVLTNKTIGSILFVGNKMTSVDSSFIEIEGLQIQSASDPGTAPTNYPVFDSANNIGFRSKTDTITDLGIESPVPMAIALG